MFNLLYSYILLWMIQRVGRSRNDFDIEIFTHGDDILITDTTNLHRYSFNHRTDTFGSVILRK